MGSRALRGTVKSHPAEMTSGTNGLCFPGSQDLEPGGCSGGPLLRAAVVYLASQAAHSSSSLSFSPCFLSGKETFLGAISPPLSLHIVVPSFLREVLPFSVCFILKPSPSPQLSSVTQQSLGFSLIPCYVFETLHWRAWVVDVFAPERS